MKWLFTLFILAFPFSLSHSAIFGGREVNRIQEEGSDLNRRRTLNFIGDPITCVDNSSNLRTDCTVVVSTSVLTGVIRDQSTLQSGATFYVSSGTVEGNLTSNAQVKSKDLYITDGSGSAELRFNSNASGSNVSLILNKNEITTSDLQLIFRLFGSTQAIMAAETGKGYVINVSTGGASIVDRILVNDGNSLTGRIRFNPSLNGFDLEFSSITFDSGSDDPILDWVTDGELRLANGKFIVVETLEVPNGANPTVDETGEFAVDTSSGQPVFYNGTSAVVLQSTISKTFNLESPTTGYFPIGFRTASDITIKSIVCVSSTSATSATVTLKDCNPSDGTDCNTIEASMSCGSTETEISEGSIDSGSVAKSRRIRPQINGLSGDPGFVGIDIYYQEVRQ